jgi:hypothetical protein
MDPEVDRNGPHGPSYNSAIYFEEASDAAHIPSTRGDVEPANALLVHQAAHVHTPRTASQQGLYDPSLAST